MDIIESFLPSTPLFYLYYLGGITFLGLLLIVLISKLHKPKPKKEVDKKLTMDDLLKIAKNPKSTQKDLLFALMMFTENFEMEKNYNKSMELFKLALFHKNRNKALFDYFHGTIIPKNLKFKDELNKLEKEALNK